jgi:outer membrane protein assembly factor BamB
VSALTRGYVALIAGALALAVGLPTSVAATPRDAGPIPYEDVVVGESPNSVAVASDGLIAAALFNDQSIALLPGGGVVRRVPLGCSPSDVAISPDASTAWAVCQGDPHLYVIDVVSGEPAVADIGLREAEDVVYLPGPRQLFIADLAGEVIAVSATGRQDYAVLERVPTGAERPSDIAMLPDGSRGFAMTDAGRLLSIDIRARIAKVMAGLVPGVFLSSVTLSRDGTLLYAGANIGTLESGFRSAILALDPRTGATVQESPLELTSPGSTTIKVAAGHRSLSVATGLGLDIDGQSTGLFDIALDEQGRLGARTRIMPVIVFGSDVSRSAAGRRIAAGTTNAAVVGAIVDDAPYPPTLGVAGRLAGTKLSLTGTTTGIPPGTRVTVRIKDLTKPKQPFVTQKAKAVVDARGAYRWTGTVKAAKVQVFVRTSTPAASPMITVSRARR